MKVCLLLAALALVSTSALGDAESEQLRYFKHYSKYCPDPLKSPAAPLSLFAAAEARMATLATAQQEARRGARCRPRSRVSLNIYTYNARIEIRCN